MTYKENINFKNIYHNQAGKAVAAAHIISSGGAEFSMDSFMCLGKPEIYNTQ